MNAMIFALRKLGRLAAVACCCYGLPATGAEHVTTGPIDPAERAAVELDWRKQDGIGTARVPSSYMEGVFKTLDRGDALMRALGRHRLPSPERAAHWADIRARAEQTKKSGALDQEAWEGLWREAHWLRRELLMAHPLAPRGPVAFIKQVPSIFSHQLTQYYGSCAQPGGGIFVLDAPGQSLRARALTAEGAGGQQTTDGVARFPMGSFQTMELSPDGRKLLFAYCAVTDVPKDRESRLDRYFHLYELTLATGAVRQLTDGPYDDFSPRYMPNGQIVFVSTRRGGYHRCGRGPCPTYTLAVAEADGSNPRPISYHETHEWDPVVLNDGQLLYTRWDYVDRHAVYYEHLWSTRPDGSGTISYYGNNTFNPVGIWEAQAIPGSTRVMATAAAHHAMTAGSIVLVDIAGGREGLGPLTRLTPDALFPESEAPVANRSNPGAWNGQLEPLKVPMPPEQQRWPGHCYRTPKPLSERLFLAAYSFDALIGEPDPNPRAMFGLYLVDADGNKELLHRDPTISSLWPVPLGTRPSAPTVATARDAQMGSEGAFFLQNVYRSWAPIPAGSVKRLRIVQVLPKATWHANEPPVGLANASPGKQVLGTVPVEPDGSAYFRAPAGIPLAFQALDAQGQAVQVMRSVAYLQPGETAGCVGCHESRHESPMPMSRPLALGREPSRIEPGPEGSLPLSYPRLVQPVLDRQCLTCHNQEKKEGGLVLTGEPEGRFSKSYLALAQRVSFSSWGGKPGDFRQVNSEPASKPGFFGARNSKLTHMLRDKHPKVELTANDWERLVTWMDANALFYGTFDPKEQQRQLRGEAIDIPKMQ